MTLSFELDLEVDRAVARLGSHPHARAVLLGHATVEQLAQYYVSAHAIVTYATRFLSEGRDAIARQGGCAPLMALFEQKATEERGHDGWLEDDLTHLGYELGAPHTPRPNAASGAYNSFHGPFAACCGEAFVGTAWVLESLAVRLAPKAVTALQGGSIAALCPGDYAGLSFLSSHGAADVEHMEELRAFVDRHLTSQDVQAYVLASARFTATIYADLFSPAS